MLFIKQRRNKHIFFKVLMNVMNNSSAANWTVLYLLKPLWCIFHVTATTFKPCNSGKCVFPCFAWIEYFMVLQILGKFHDPIAYKSNKTKKAILKPLYYSKINGHHSWNYPPPPLCNLQIQNCHLTISQIDFVLAFYHVLHIWKY